MAVGRDLALVVLACLAVLWLLSLGFSNPSPNIVHLAPGDSAVSRVWLKRRIRTGPSATTASPARPAILAGPAVPEAGMSRSVPLG